MFSLEVFDIDFKRYGFIEHYTYASYTEKMTDAGYFEISCPATNDNIEKIKRDRLIWFEGDTAGIIQCIIKEKSEVTTITVKGLLLNGILEWRYIYPTITVTDMDALSVMEKYVTENMISSNDERRNFPMLEIGQRRNALTATKVTKQITGYTVMNGLQKVCDAIPENVGFKVGFYPREKKFKFYVFVGEDKTTNQEAISQQVFFSQNFNNVLSLSYTNNNEDFRGCALIQAERQVEGQGGDSGSTGGGTGSGSTGGSGGSNITVDSQLSEVSENPVQNRVITAKVNEITESVEGIEKSYNDLSEAARTGSYKDLLDKPMIPVIPDAIKNPQPLKFTGIVTETYDGSLPVVVNLPYGGANVEVDSELSSESENPVQNKVIEGVIKRIDAEIEKASLILESLKDVAKTGSYNDLIDKPSIPEAVIVDSELADSANPVQNRAINEKILEIELFIDSVTETLSGLKEVAITGSYNDLLDKPDIPELPEIDSELSSESINPVQNKAVYDKVKEIQESIYICRDMDKESDAKNGLIKEGAIVFTYN